MKRQVIAGLVIAILSAVGGYNFAAALYGRDIADLREDYATRAQALETKYREREQIATQSLVKAWEERDAAYARMDDLSNDVDRVRKQADAYRRQLSANADVACKPEREQLARCASLLERGAGVVGRCAGLAERVAIDKDAIVNIVEK